jgi:hypothetical protein
VGLGLGTINLVDEQVFQEFVAVRIVFEIVNQLQVLFETVKSPVEFDEQEEKNQFYTIGLGC